MMFQAFERMVAWRYLRARRKEGFISVIAGFSFLGIALGVATLIVVMAVMNGFRHELTGRILGINAHLSVSAPGGVLDFDKLAGTFTGIPGVISAAPVVHGQALASANGISAGVAVRGMRIEDLRRKKLIADHIAAGRLDGLEQGFSVLIGARLAEAMRLVPGDTIRLISPDATQTFLGAMPRLKDFTVAGVFDIGMYEYDSGALFMTLPDAQVYFDMKGRASAIELETSDQNRLDPVISSVQAATGEDYRVTSWQQAHAHFLNALEVERNVMFLILALIILVAAFNIVAGMVMLVTTKGREVAILRTIGATRGAVMRIFFLCGAVIGVAGTFLGFLLGLGFAANIEEIRHLLEGLTHTELFAAEIYFLSKLPAIVETGDVIRITAMALVLSLLATLYPAWRAARILPADGLRHE